MVRPLIAGLSLLPVFLTAVAGRADAQSLGDAARKAQEERKATTASSLVFDARDLDPGVAHQELLDFALQAARCSATRESSSG